EVPLEPRLVGLGELELVPDPIELHPDLVPDAPPDGLELRLLLLVLRRRGPVEDLEPLELLLEIGPLGREPLEDLVLRELGARDRISLVGLDLRDLREHDLESPDLGARGGEVLVELREPLPDDVRLRLRVEDRRLLEHVEALGLGVAEVLLQRIDQGLDR